MTPREKLQVVHPDDDALDTLTTLGAGDINQLPVVEDANLRGLVRREDILKWLALQRRVAYAERPVCGFMTALVSATSSLAR
jgi:hypothetical protein